jgi:hypothetical protein
MIVDYPIESSNGSGSAIVYDDEQDLTTEQQLQALANLGITRNAAGEWEVPTTDGTKRIILVD